MKIAVYSISKNEAKHVNRFMYSARDADGVYVLDTGSTDDTAKMLIAAGAKVEQKIFEQWRFDFARNTALMMIPNDYDACVVLDLDEVLVPGWRDSLEKEIKSGATRIQARYTFSWTADGKPHCKQLLGVTTKMGNVENGVTHYAQAFLEVDTTTGTVAKVRQIYFLVVDEGKGTEAAYYDAQSVPTAEVDLVVASKLATVIKVP